MGERWRRLTAELMTEGLGHVTRRVLSPRLRRAGLIDWIDADQRRLQLSSDFNRRFSSVVRYGPFRGLRLGADSWWGSSDRAAMLFGLYELEVLASLKALPSEYTILIDLGAADGFYGVGVLTSRLFERSICYEMSAQGRAAIAENALLNGVDDRVEIRGMAGPDFDRDLTQEVRDACVLLVDIEGAEFELLQRRIFEAFHRSVIIVEIHDWFFEDGNEKLRRLKEASVGTHSITEFTTGSRDLSGLPELQELCDTDRWLICSEGRARLMTWLRFDPA